MGIHTLPTTMKLRNWSLIEERFTGSRMVLHNHRDPADLVYAGFSGTAPSYHLWRCERDTCYYTVIRSCARRLLREECRWCP